jgi:hypothetical protein
MEAICSSETSVDLTTRRYIPDDRTLHNPRCDNLKSSCILIFRALLGENGAMCLVAEENLPNTFSCTLFLVNLCEVRIIIDNNPNSCECYHRTLFYNTGSTHMCSILMLFSTIEIIL